MSWQQVSYIAVVVQTVIVATSVVIQVVIVATSALFIRLQLRKQTELARAANVQALAEIITPLRVLLIQDKELTEIYLDGPKKYEQFSEVNKYRYRRLVYWQLTFYENAYYQHHNHLLDDEIYSGWKAGLKELAIKLPETLWQEAKEKYVAGLVDAIDIERRRHASSEEKRTAR